MAGGLSRACDSLRGRQGAPEAGGRPVPLGLGQVPGPGASPWSVQKRPSRLSILSGHPARVGIPV